jgi:hypothetical protein
MNFANTLRRTACTAGLVAAFSGAALCNDLTIKNIHCTSTEDWSGADNNQLRVYVDGNAKPVIYNYRLNDGQNWALNKTFKYNKSIKVEMWDLDDPDPDDLLGTLNVGPTSKAGSSLSARFTRDDSDYTFSYEIKAVAGGMAPKTKALFALENWRTNGVAGKFKTINKAKMIEEITTRINLPWKMDQSKQSLCGPMTILMALALKDPERYVHMAKTMYETGRYYSRGKTVQPGAHLYTAAVPTDTPHVDWMLAASMRDSENAIFDYDDGDKFAGITSPGEMSGWFQTIVGCDKSDFNSTYAWGEKKELGVAWDAVRAGNVAAIFVDHSFMPGQPASQVNHPDHWVLLFDVQSIGSQVKFRVLSWGKVLTIDLNTDRFEDLFWGAVVGYGPGSKY